MIEGILSHTSAGRLETHSKTERGYQRINEANNMRG